MRALSILLVTALIAPALLLAGCCCPDKCSPAKEECCDKTSGHYNK